MEVKHTMTAFTANLQQRRDEVEAEWIALHEQKREAQRSLTQTKAYIVALNGLMEAEGLERVVLPSDPE